MMIVCRLQTRDVSRLNIATGHDVGCFFHVLLFSALTSVLVLIQYTCLVGMSVSRLLWATPLLHRMVSKALLGCCIFAQTCGTSDRLYLSHVVELSISLERRLCDNMLKIKAAMWVISITDTSPVARSIWFDLHCIFLAICRNGPL